MKAILLAGGKGTRLRPYTATLPKPLMPIGDQTIIEVLLRQLAHHGVDEAILCIGHQAALIEAVLGDGARYGLRISYRREEQPLGTVGPLKAIASELPERFLVMNGDLLTDLDFDALVQFHREQEAVLTIATHARHVKVDLGIVEFDERNRITHYLEKPESTYHVSMGIYVYEPSVLKHIQPGQYIDFPDIVLKLLERGEKVCAYPSDCLWLDIGRPDDYARAQEIFAEKKEVFDLV